MQPNLSMRAQHLTYRLTEAREPRMRCEQLLSHFALHYLLLILILLILLLLNLILLEHVLDGGDVGDVLRHYLVNKVHPFPDVILKLIHRKVLIKKQIICSDKSLQHNLLSFKQAR